jgi:hypothetical protein
VSASGTSATEDLASWWADGRVRTNWIFGGLLILLVAAAASLLLAAVLSGAAGSVADLLSSTTTSASSAASSASTPHGSGDAAQLIPALWAKLFFTSFLVPLDVKTGFGLGSEVRGTGPGLIAALVVAFSFVLGRSMEAPMPAPASAARSGLRASVIGPVVGLGCLVVYLGTQATVLGSGLLSLSISPSSAWVFVMPTLLAGGAAAAGAAASRQRASGMVGRGSFRSGLLLAIPGVLYAALLTALLAFGIYVWLASQHHPVTSGITNHAVSTATTDAVAKLGGLSLVLAVFYLPNILLGGLAAVVAGIPVTMSGPWWALSLGPVVGLLLAATRLRRPLDGLEILSFVGTTVAAYLISVWLFIPSPALGAFPVGAVFPALFAFTAALCLAVVVPLIPFSNLLGSITGVELTRRGLRRVWWPAPEPHPTAARSRVQVHEARWLAETMLLLLIGVGAAAGIAAMTTPDRIVRSYLEAEQAGDGNSAWALSQVDNGGLFASSPRLVSAEGLDATLQYKENKPKPGWRIVSMTVKGSDTAVAVVQDGDTGPPHEIQLVNQKSDRVGGIVPAWRVVPKLATLTISPHPSWLKARVDDIPVDGGVFSVVRVFPGVHNLTYGASAVFAEVRTSFTAAPGAATDLTYGPPLAASLRPSLQQALTATFQTCTQAAAARPKACPNSAFVFGTVTNDSWKLDRPPVMEKISSGDAEGDVKASGRWHMVFSYDISFLGPATHHDDGHQGTYTATLSYSGSAWSIKDLSGFGS